MQRKSSTRGTRENPRCNPNGQRLTPTLQCVACRGKGLTLRRIFLCLYLFVLLSVPIALAQAPIDPSLPEAPLPHKRALLLFPGYDVVPQATEPVAPLRNRQKFLMAYHSTFDPSFLLRSGIVTIFDKSLSVGPDYGRGVRGEAQLFGSNCASLASTFLLSDAIVPALVHQDPRYFRKGAGSAKSRIWWALRSEFVAFNDRGDQVPNYGVLVGFGLSTVLSDAYLPPKNVSVGKTFEGYSIKIGTNFGLNLLHEYGGVARMRRILLRQRNSFAPANPSTERTGP